MTGVSWGRGAGDGAGRPLAGSRAWVGVVKALAGWGDSCGLPMRSYKYSAIPARWAGQAFPKFSKRFL